MGALLLLLLATPINLSDAKPFETELVGSPEVATAGDVTRIATEGSSGGVAYLLDEPIVLTEETQLTWTWAVEQFPDATPSFPMSKKQEDFAIRVGLLLSDGKFRVPLPKPLRRELVRRDSALSHVLFYCAVREKPDGKRCGKSPFHDQVVNCLTIADMEDKKIDVTPLQDLRSQFGIDEPVKVIGIWLVGDSDNSESDSAATVQSLSVTEL